MKTLKFAQLNCMNREQENRLGLIAEHLGALEADIVAVQEVIEPDAFLAAMAAIGLTHGAFRPSPKKKGGFDFQGILSRTPLESASGSRGRNGVVVARTKVGERMVNVFSAHFAWGPDNEHARLMQADFIESTAASLERADKGSLSILGGDLNSESAGRAVRYLSGLDLGPDGRSSTKWTDAWVTSGLPHNEATASHSTNELGRNTAFGADVLYPGLLPDRRIDYIFTRGWNYGKIGHPLTFDYIVDPLKVELSDHNGIYSEILTEVNGA